MNDDLALMSIKAHIELVEGYRMLLQHFETLEKLYKLSEAQNNNLILENMELRKEIRMLKEVNHE